MFNGNSVDSPATSDKHGVNTMRLRMGHMRLMWASHEMEQVLTAEPASVEALLGVVTSKQASRLALAYSIENGLPVAALDRLADTVAPDDARFKFRLVPKATLDRRRRSSSMRLTSEEGDRLARLAKVFSFALDIYKDPGKAREFLNRPHPMLDNKVPLEVALATGPGADLVINVLGRAAYGGGV